MMNSQTNSGPAPVLSHRHGYSDGPDGLQPVPLTLSIGVTASLFAAYLLLPQSVIEKIPGFDPIEIEHIELPKVPPPPERTQVQPDERKLPPETTIVNPPPLIPILPKGPLIGTVEPNDLNKEFSVELPGTGKQSGAGTGIGPTLPVLTAVRIDPRFANNFQPDYPASKIRREEEGIARVRVLIGADGRVRDVVDAGSSDAAFFRATEHHAKRSWRFKPATRDGVAFESWHVMTVTFTLTD